jgi:hypothetical protein
VETAALLLSAWSPNEPTLALEQAAAEEQSNGYFDIITCRLPDNETVTRAQSQNACWCVMLRSRDEACRTVSFVAV